MFDTNAEFCGIPCTTEAAVETRMRRQDGRHRASHPTVRKAWPGRRDDAPHVQGRMSAHQRMSSGVRTADSF
ncbi:hypothetical protein ABZV80_39855 [Streptomyces sp. NPDC005132]|uniref:hypothetical protein n=1 Tax=Streptomyces sp. NPDC005132 TaxID=3154294 RepID=UPI0033A4D561